MINFELTSAGPISAAFLKNQCSDFTSACHYVQTTPYARILDKDNLLAVISENRGTCSTKHALLKVLLEEQEIRDVKLMLGIYLMTAENSPLLKDLILKTGLTGIPEAHCYLRLQDQILDFTFPERKQLNFEKDLIKEITIEASQIGSYKVQVHQQFMRDWLSAQTSARIGFKELWQIRESAIAILSEFA